MIKKKDFVEIDFIGKIKESGQVFDATIKQEAEKLGVKDSKPIKVCIGEEMLVKGFDDSLEGKEIGKDYSIELPPAKAFGARKQNLIKIIPISVFLEKQVNPYPGLVLNMDGAIARVSAVSGGRVITDFNSPLSGKTIIYEFKILRKIDEKEEKLKALADFFLGKNEVKIEGNKGIVTSDKTSKELIKKARELLDLEIEIKEEKKNKD
jgi:FKBP-type peptidyl-prolyl cis-trans isomerase 2